MDFGAGVHSEYKLVAWRQEPLLGGYIPRGIWLGVSDVLCILLCLPLGVFWAGETTKVWRPEPVIMEQGSSGHDSLTCGGASQ